MNQVERVYDLTDKLIDYLETSVGSDRDERIRRIEEFLEQRELLIQQLTGPFSEEEKELGERLAGLNEQVALLFKKEKQGIQKDIKELNMKKQSNEKYANPYQNLSTDGMFYDKKN